MTHGIILGSENSKFQVIVFCPISTHKQLLKNFIFTFGLMLLKVRYRFLPYTEKL